MNVPGLRSPYEQVGGIYHFARMLDKIQLHAAGNLPADYQTNLGEGFDAGVCRLVGMKYEDVVARVKQGGTDAEILTWCFQNGRTPAEHERTWFNEYLRKRGWNDVASERLVERVKTLGPQWAGQVRTFFDVIEVDEGRPPRAKV